MAVRSKGLRSKTRHILRKSPRDRGMPPITHTLREFPEGSTVAIKINPAVHSGMPHRRFQGLTGKVLGRRGEGVRVSLYAGNKLKELVVRPEHLKTVG